MQKALVEFIGTFFLILTVALCLFSPNSAGPMAPVAIAAVLVAMVYAGGHVSGAHYNPAVTLAVFLRGKCSKADLPFYLIPQLLAAVAAPMVMLYLTPDAVIETVSHSPGYLIVAEALFTFALCYVVLNVATAKANSGNSHYGIAIGFTVLAGAYAVKAAFNPAVAVALVVLGRLHASDIWMNLVGEALGAVAAVFAFKASVKDQS